MRIKRLVLEDVAKDLARQARDQGGGDDKALAAFRRFLDQDRAILAQCPSDAVLAAGRLWELLQRDLNADRRRRRGMFFTPRPLVEFVVRSVEQCLGRFDQSRRLHVIDPACGYGGFLMEAQRQIEAGCFSGLEIDPQTCAVAHVLTGECNTQQPQIRHANPLLAGQSLRQVILGPPDEPLTPIILGNPPWSNFGRQNRGAWIDGLLADYRAGLVERKSNLSDDAIKFIRWSQYWVEQAATGLVALVTPNTWLAGLTHRRMRESLLGTFDELFVLDLHGETGDPSDENVFGIRSGVAIVLGVRLARRASIGETSTLADVRFASLRGTRVEKLAALNEHTLQSLARTPVHPAGPAWLLVESHARQSPCRCAADRYASFWPLDRVFRHYTSGVQTKNDDVFVAFTREGLTAQMQAWLAELPERPLFDAALIRPYLLAPFDRRYVYYDPRLLGRARYSVMRHMLQPNLGLVFMRQSTNPGEYDHFLAADCLVCDRVFYSRHGAPFLAPLWLEGGDQRSEVGGQGGRDSGFRDRGSGRAANFSDDFFTAVAAVMGKTPEPLDLFQYLYAIAHSQTYRANYAAELRRGFPRFPLPLNCEQFCRLSGLGRRLAELHVATSSGDCPGAGLLPPIAGQEGADAAFRLGGYDVLKRWTRPRQASGLPADDKRELARLAWIGCETRRRMREIDQVAGDAPWGSPQPPPPGVSIVSTSPG